MIISDNIIENQSFFLRNLNKNSAAKDTWQSGTGYGFYSVPYESDVLLDHVYYMRFTYKFTTTNQSPTWCEMYYFDGVLNSGARINNPVAGTEYTASTIRHGDGYKQNGYSTHNNYGTIYNGPSSAISGVTSYVKNVLIYDITGLYAALLARGLASNDATVKTWCDNNLEYHQHGSNYDIRSLLSDLTKVSFKKGDLVADIVECDGMRVYSSPTTLRDHTYFDTGSGIGVYNNSGGGTVTHSRISAAAQVSPFYPEHPYILKIVTNGTASPSAGGFYTNHIAAANKIFIEKFVAKIPKGYSLREAYNSQGTGASITWLTPTKGTGEWEEYAILYKCGSEGSFSSGGHVYCYADGTVSGCTNTSVTWYLAYINSCDITGKEYLKNYTVLPNKDVMKSNIIFSRNFDNMSLFPNGDGSDSQMILPSGWTWDTTDVAGNAFASIVQPVGVDYGWIGPFKMNPSAIYKISMYIKSKKDMTSYLAAIRYSVTPNTDALLHHPKVGYVTGTYTKLTADLVNGATQLTVSSNANWISRSGSGLGFRSNAYKSWNDMGSVGFSSAGLIKGISGSTIVTLNSAYSGSTIKSGTYVVESFNGNTYYYPIRKAEHPTDNSWKYVENTFGTGTFWDGRGGGWAGIPFDAEYMWLALNYYANDGTVPIKYCDIKIQQVGTYADMRSENKIAFKKFN